MEKYIGVIKFFCLDNSKNKKFSFFVGADLTGSALLTLPSQENRNRCSTETKVIVSVSN